MNILACFTLMASFRGLEGWLEEGNSSCFWAASCVPSAWAHLLDLNYFISFLFLTTKPYEVGVVKIHMYRKLWHWNIRLDFSNSEMAKISPVRPLRSPQRWRPHSRDGRAGASALREDWQSLYQCCVLLQVAEIPRDGTFMRKLILFLHTRRRHFSHRSDRRLRLRIA